MLVLGSERLALSIAATHPTVLVELYAADWRTVDRARESVHALGLCDRVTVRHRSAIAAVIDGQSGSSQPSSQGVWPRVDPTRHPRTGDR